MKDSYEYVAMFNYAEDGISISFPDLPGCLSCADTTKEAIKNAEEVHTKRLLLRADRKKAKT